MTPLHPRFRRTIRRETGNEYLVPPPVEPWETWPCGFQDLVGGEWDTRDVAGNWSVTVSAKGMYHPIVVTGLRPPNGPRGQAVATLLWL